jgi:phytol kinase
MGSPWAGVTLVLAIFSALLLGLRAYQRVRSPNPEWLRKLLHLAMGMVALAFPWLFAAIWPVILLAIGLASFLTALKLSVFLRRFFGGVIDAVERESLGEIYFPISVGLLFLLSEGDPILFCIPVLILTLPDTAAALVGRRYGGLRYKRFGNAKSVEGSLAFLGVVFPSTYIPLLLFAGTGRSETLLIGLTLSLLLTLVEAISVRGLDNLFLPLGAFFLLQAYLPLEVNQLAVHLGIAFVLFIPFGFFCLRCSRQPQEGLV